MTKIVRTATKVTGGVTDDELARMRDHSALWINQAFRTDPIEPDKIVPAIERLYAAAGLKKPRVVIAPSPLVMAFAYGASAAIWSQKGATYRATEEATAEATNGATDEATNEATDEATRSATYSATDRATAEATRRATAEATNGATNGATHSATNGATNGAESGASKACRDLAGDIGIQYALGWHSAYQGGNMWAAFDCYLTSFRDVLGLYLPCHEKYVAWEQAAIHGGFRVLHPEFCIVSDFPEIIRVDGQNRPHCADGPSHKWRDGWALYHWHGVRIPDDWIGGGLDAKTAVTWPNVEQRRAAIEILGWQNVLSALDAKSLGGNPDPKIGELIEVQLPFEDDKGNATTRALFLKAQCGTGRTIFEAVDPDEIDIDPRFDPAWCAQAWRDGYSPADWLPPSFRT
jgi:hypothetical protein